MNPLRVLIIEDSEDSVLLLLLTLREGGYEPVSRCVQTEQELRHALQAEPWDLVLSDHDMPGFSAPEALAVFQESQLNIPFIIVSGAIGEELAAAAMKAGAHDFVMKRNLSRLVPAVQRELREAENRREQRKIEQESQEHYREIQVLSGRILRAFEEERSRLARELHDEIGQALTVINMDLQYLQVKLSSLDPADQDKLANSIKLLRETLHNVRRQILALRPPSLDKMGLVEVVREMAREVGDRAGLKISVQEKGLSMRLPQEIETALYRCIQEALTNTVRHAEASNVQIGLQRIQDQVFASIVDDGIGLSPEQVKNNPNGGVGLAGLRERVSLLNGTIQLDTAPGKGFRINIAIPFSGYYENGGSGQ